MDKEIKLGRITLSYGYTDELKKRMYFLYFYTPWFNDGAMSSSILGVVADIYNSIIESIWGKTEYYTVLDLDFMDAVISDGKKSRLVNLSAHSVSRYKPIKKGDVLTVITYGLFGRGKECYLPANNIDDLCCVFSYSFFWRERNFYKLINNQWIKV